MLCTCPTHDEKDRDTLDPENHEFEPLTSANPEKSKKKKVASIPILSTRFNDESWLQNVNYRRKHPEVICIYGSPKMQSPKFMVDQLLFVVEMNNTTNQIEGIGLIRNRPDSVSSRKNGKRVMPVYEMTNWNRYLYQGRYRMDREELVRLNPKVVECLDYILFREKTHMKRGSGMTHIPEKLLNHEVCKKNQINLKKELMILFREKYQHTYETITKLI